MNIEDFRNFCLSFKSATEDLPFDETTLVFKVAGKMFALTDIDNFVSINVKCEPEKALILREKYSAVIPVFHMNKKHWNTIKIDDTIPDKMIKQWVADSYNLIVNKLPKKIKKEILQII